jgi:hypothetical protein
MTWREERIEAVRAGIAAAIPCLEIWPSTDGGFFACWPGNGEGVGVMLPDGIRIEDAPPADVAIAVSVRSLMERAPIAGHG